MDILHGIVECLKKHGYNVLFAAYIGSRMRGDYVEGLSDYDVVVVVDKIREENIDECIPHDVELILVPKEKINSFSGDPICVDIAFGTPYIDRIGLRERCLHNIKNNVSFSRIRDLEVIINKMLRSPEEYVDIVGLLIYPYLRELLSLLSVRRRRLVSRRELFGEISRFGVPISILSNVYVQYAAIKRRLNREIRFDAEDIVRLCRAIKRYLERLGEQA